MAETTDYELLDMGAGRKLERFGAEILDRPSPAAEGLARSAPDRWDGATARFDHERGGSGTWSVGDRAIDPDELAWPIEHDGVRLVLQLRPSANIGVFPEQTTNWDWIAAQVRAGLAFEPDRAPRVLNLFAYTGAASLVAAAAGAEVTHVDSSGPTVAWARRNADASGLTDRPIRWLVEDAMTFVARECRRGNRYDGVIADPPTYGHGPKGRPFKFAEQVDELAARCGELLDAEVGQRFLVFSCHAPGFGPEEARSAIAGRVPQGGTTTSRPLTVDTADGRSLAAGVCVRWRSSPA